MGKHVRLMDRYDAEILEERYNPLIGRIEVLVKITHFNDGTPSRGAIKQGLAKLYGKTAEHVYIRRVHTEYGLPITQIEAHIYDSVERARFFEPEYIIKRDEESLSKVSTSKS